MKTTITKHKRPLLVTLAMWYCGLAIFPFLMIAYTGSTEKSMYVNGVLRNNDYFIKNELIWCIVEALLCAFIFWAIKKEKWWFQPIPLILWSIICLTRYIQVPGDWLSLSISFGVGAGFTLWYFYYKAKVREYFNSLKKDSLKNLQPLAGVGFRK